MFLGSYLTVGGPSILVILLIVAVLTAHALIAVALVIHLGCRKKVPPPLPTVPTRRSGFYYFAGVVTTLVILIVCGAVWFVTVGLFDNYKILSSAPSPDGKYVATVYRNWGGGAIGWSDVRVNVNPVSAPFTVERARKDWDRLVFLIDSHHEVDTKWDGDRSLVISYRSSNKTFGTELYKKPSDESGNIDIRYLEE